MSDYAINVLIAVFGLLFSIIGFLLVFILLRIVKKQDDHEQRLNNKGKLIAALHENQVALGHRQDRFDALVTEIGRDLKELIAGSKPKPSKR